MYARLCTGLSLDDRIGSFLPGREADFIVVDYAATSVQKLRMEYLRSRDKWTIENKLFGLQTSAMTGIRYVLI